MSSIEDRVKKIVVEQLGVKEEDVTPNASFVDDVGFSKALAKEVASRNITVNVVAPGFIDTDMTRGLNDEVKEMLLKSIPAGRMGAPADIASAVEFLVSEGANYITGETIHVNGGMLME